MQRILLVGGYGYLDVGDEAQLTAVLYNLKKFIPDACLTILSDNVVNTLKYHDVKTDFSIGYYLQSTSFKKIKKHDASATVKLQKFNTNSLIPLFQNIFSKIIFFVKSIILIFNAQRLKKDKKTYFLNEALKHFLDTLKCSDLLFFVGGGYLTSIWSFNLRSQCLTIILSRIFEKPVILSGQTIGPFHGLFDRLIARYALNQVNLITLREKFSGLNLRNLGITKPLIQVTADDSVTLPSADQTNFEVIMENEGIKIQRPLIGMNIIGLHYLKKFKAKMNKARKLLANIADKLIDKYGATILFVPLQYGGDSDVPPSLDVLQLMRNKDRAFIISQQYDEKVIKDIVGQMDLAIGFRYHFNIFAVTSGVPAIGIYLDNYYSIKIKGLFDLIDQPKNAINIEEATLDKVMEMVREIFSNKEQISNSLRKQTEVLKNRSLTTIRFAKILLSQKEWAYIKHF